MTDGWGFSELNTTQRRGPAFEAKFIHKAGGPWRVFLRLSIIRGTTFFLVSILSLAAADPGFKASIFRPGAKPAFQKFVVQESLAGVPDGFARVGPTAHAASVNLRIALSSGNIAGLKKALLDISDPSSPNYGNHLTKAEVNAFVAPSHRAVAAVHAWLSSHRLVAKPMSSAGHWLSVSVPVSKANSMMSANYETFKHVASGKTYARTLSFSLPAEVAEFIDHIHPTTGFNNPHSRGPILSTPQVASAAGSSNGTAASCAAAITPACLQSLYNIPTTPATQSSNSIVVAGFIEQFARRTDLKRFLKLFRSDMDSTTTFTTQKIDKGHKKQSSNAAGLEANLDIQYTLGIATGVPISFVSVGESFEDGDLEGSLDIVNFLSDQENVPQVMTTSYGSNEAQTPPALAFKLCEAFMAFGARGVSILFSSGDGGPYVTAVGSTGGIPETASTFSSGGFSNFFSTPDYQSTTVATYLKAQGTVNDGLFNASGRGYPDVAAQGENVQIVLSGNTTSVFGTSASTPIFASIISLLNDRLIAVGRPPLGFLSPWLYANPGMFNDTTGSNPGCNATGFAALSGWDPVTGLGTPDFTKMKAAAGL
ncbi:family S53 protease [Mycena vulgaris]|nr:family S53 protease [Mycena vulgaris]